MKRAGLFVIAVLLSGSCSFAQTSPISGAKQPPPLSSVLSIAVDPPPSPIRLGSPTIKVTVIVKNISDKEIYLETVRSPNGVAAYMDFGYLLTKDGREVETTFFHRKITGRNREGDPQEVWAGSFILLPHPPGVIYQMLIDLKRLYEIKEPGVYALEVSRFDQDHKTKVRSNTLGLKILP